VPNQIPTRSLQRGSEGLASDGFKRTAGREPGALCPPPCRRHGLIAGKRSQRDATVAIDLYLSATGRTNREEVRELTRLSNRWATLSGRYPLLLTTFTDVAERIMYVSSLPIYGFMTLISQSSKTRITNHSLNALAEEICRVYPTALIVASDYVAKDAELAVRSGPAYDPGRAQEVLA